MLELLFALKETQLWCFYTVKCWLFYGTLNCSWVRFKLLKHSMCPCLSKLKVHLPRWWQFFFFWVWLPSRFLSSSFLRDLSLALWSAELYFSKAELSWICRSRVVQLLLLCEDCEFESWWYHSHPWSGIQESKNWMEGAAWFLLCWS